MTIKTLSPKQKQFCHEYLLDFNGTQAAIRCGYSANSARVHAARLLADVNIQAELRKNLGERAERTQIDIDWLVRKYKDIASFDITDVAEFNGQSWSFKPQDAWSQEATAAIEISGIDDNGNLKIRQISKISALDSLAKHLGLFNDFQTAILAFKSYGLDIIQGSDGSWSVIDTNKRLTPAPKDPIEDDELDLVGEN